MAKKLKSDKSKTTKKRIRLGKFRNYCITTFKTKNYKKWKNLDLADLKIRYFVYQLETTSKGRIHIQAYIETYDQLRISQLKARLGDRTLHAEPREGTREAARDYCLKDDSPYFSSTYPDWSDHEPRIPGTETVELGTFKTRQGQRTDLSQVADMIDAGKTELEIFEDCPSQYLKYSTGIRRARALKMQAQCNKYIPNLKVHVLWGDSRAGKTRYVFDTEGAENCYIPKYSESAGKFWFDGYDGQKVLLINEFYGQARTNVMQELLDHYRIQVEIKGSTTISNWDTIYITSNCHPDEWYSSWETIPEKVQLSFIRRISTITEMKEPAQKKLKQTWAQIPSLRSCEDSSITLTTSEARGPRKPSPSHPQETKTSSVARGGGRHLSFNNTISLPLTNTPLRNGVSQIQEEEELSQT